MRRRWISALIVASAVAACSLVGFGVDARSADTRVTAPALPAQAPANRPLFTGIMDGASLTGQDTDVAYSRMRVGAGARFVRLEATWAQIAPIGDVMPAGFQPRNPNDPRYRWTFMDRLVTRAVAGGLTPILYLVTAPSWVQSGPKQRANDGPRRPSPTAFADFATAIATRYSGSPGLPRVRYWQVWNEPNLNINLTPQLEGGKAASPAWYRSLVNAGSSALHAVRRDNVVIAGGLAPFGSNTNDPSGGTIPDQERLRPLHFMRELLCMSGGAKPKPTCKEKTAFDVWAHHPYTYGGPTHQAFHKDDVSLGDLGDMRTLLAAAAKAGRVTPKKQPQFWVTEFSYDSAPADPKGLPIELHARWVSEAMYRMWSNGVSVVTWFILRDRPFPDSMFQSGLYFRGQGVASDAEKPALRAFRFPFVAFRAKNKTVTYWGRSPSSARAKIVIERRAGKQWKRVSRLTTNKYGIFQGQYKTVSGGSLRARLANGKDYSHGFSLRPVKDFRFCPWGSFC